MMLRSSLTLMAIGALISHASSAQPTVLIGAENDWAPYSSSPDAGAPASGPVQGFAVDLVRAGFAAKGIKAEFLALPFARCMLYASTGRVVGCFNATITEDNKLRYLWHQPAMFEEELSIFARASSSADKLTLADLRGRSVGYTNGYTYPTEFMQDTAIKKHSATSDQYLLKMLLSGRVDYILLNRSPGHWRINGSPEFAGKAKRVGTISLDGFWIAFSKQHPDGARMAELFGQGLVELRQNGSYQRMLSEFRRKIGDR